ncbi:hypothetical protein FQA39_LY19307 [Lamprigera yunnana]|nr:hypothetical protein FQA39_LY19307 [Lamprigera yunnana]
MAEAQWMVDEIQSLVKTDAVPRSEIAVLYRSNAQSRILETNLFNAGVPYRVYGGLRFFERAEIKHALAYLRLLDNPHDNTSFMRVANFPPRGIGARTTEQLQEAAQAAGCSLHDAATTVAGKAGSKLQAFVALMDVLREETQGKTLRETIERMLQASGLVEHYQSEKEGADRIDNLGELVTAAESFVTQEGFGKDAVAIPLDEQDGPGLSFTDESPISQAPAQPCMTRSPAPNWALSRQLVAMKTDCRPEQLYQRACRNWMPWPCEPGRRRPGAFLREVRLQGLDCERWRGGWMRLPKIKNPQRRFVDAANAAGHPPPPKNFAVKPSSATLAYHTILTEPQLDAWLAKINAAELTAIDTETDSLDAKMVARIVGISFSVQIGEAAYIPLRHEGMDVPEQLDMTMVLAASSPWLEAPAHKKLGQHVKYDQHVFANHGITVRGYAHDTMLASYVLEATPAQPDQPGAAPHGAHRHQLRRPVRQGQKPDPVCQVAVDKAAAYSCEDSDQTLNVHQVLWPQIRQRRAATYFMSLENADQRSAAFALSAMASALRRRGWRPEQRPILLTRPSRLCQ